MLSLIEQKYSMSTRNKMQSRLSRLSRLNTTVLASRNVSGLHASIGDRSHHLMQLSDKEFMNEITKTRDKFNETFPELSNIIFEYNKQCTLLQLDFWYTKPLPQRCERFFEMDVNSLMHNIEEESEAGKAIRQLSLQLLCDYLPHKYQSFDV